MERFSSVFKRFKELTGNQIQPIDISEDDILMAPFRELKRKHKGRYELYRKLFLHEKRITKGQESVLSNEEVNDMGHYVSFLNSLSVRVKTLKKSECIKIHPLRLKMVEGVLNGLEQGHRTGYISAPTQSGKTWAMTEILKSCGRKRIILCDSTELVKQTSFRLHDSGINNSMYYSNIKESLENDVIVTTYDSFRNLINKGKENGGLNKEDIDLLILDEAHEALGKKTREQVSEIKALGTNIIGLSATPEFHEEKSLLGLLDHCYCDISIKEAGEDGLIANFKSIFAFTETDLSEVEFNRGEYNEDEYLHAIKNEKRTKSIWELYDKYLKFDENGREQKGLVFGNRIEYIEHMHEYFTNRGVPCGMITGSTGDEERAYLISEWKKGNIKILFGVQAIAQGISFDGGDFIVCADATFSKVKQGQRCGRSMGVDFENPDRIVKIVEIIDRDTKRNIYPVTFPQIAKASELIRVKVRQDKEKEPETKFVDEDLAELLKTQSKTVLPKIEGLRVTIDPKEIMTVVSEQERGYDLAQGKLLEPEKLLEEIKKYPEIDGDKSYDIFVKNPDNKDKVKCWPLALHSYLISRRLGTVNEWIAGEKGNGLNINLDELLQLVKQKHPQITGKTTYEDFIVKNPELTKKWPSRTTIKTRTGLNVGEWIKGKKPKPDDLLKLIKSKYPQITGTTSYQKFKDENPGITQNWPSWGSIQEQTGMTFGEWLIGKKGVKVELNLSSFLSDLKASYPYVDTVTKYINFRKQNSAAKDWPSYATIQTKLGMTFTQFINSTPVEIQRILFEKERGDKN